MKIKVLDNQRTFDRYTIILDDDVYIMSENPMSPDGINMYVGKEGEVYIEPSKELKVIPTKLIEAVLEKTIGG